MSSGVSLQARHSRMPRICPPYKEAFLVLLYEGGCFVFLGLALVTCHGAGGAWRDECHVGDWREALKAFISGVSGMLTNSHAALPVSVISGEELQNTDLEHRHKNQLLLRLRMCIKGKKLF